MQDSTASMFEPPQDALAAPSGSGEPAVAALPPISTLVIDVHACISIYCVRKNCMHACLCVFCFRHACEICQGQRAQLKRLLSRPARKQ